MEPPAPLHLQPRPSRCLALWLGGLHAAALLALVLTSLDQALRWVLGAGVAGSWAFGAYRHWRGGDGLELIWTPEGHWVVRAGGRPEMEVRDWHAPWVGPALVLLRLRRSVWRYRNIVLCPDSLGAEAHRRLRVRLRGDRGVGRNCPESAPSARTGPDR